MTEKSTISLKEIGIDAIHTSHELFYWIKLKNLKFGIQEELIEEISHIN